MRVRVSVGWISCALMTVLVGASCASLRQQNRQREEHRIQAVQSSFDGYFREKEGKTVVFVCRDSRFEDAALAHVINDVPDLQFIDIGGSSVTDDGLMQLVRLSQLKRLMVYRSRVTVDGARLFQKMRPSVRIDILE